jgi:hypothetical protein
MILAGVMVLSIAPLPAIAVPSDAGSRVGLMR